MAASKNVVMTDLTKPAKASVKEIGDSFQQLKLKKSEVVCDFISEDMVRQTGTILQFVNLNATGMATMIGGTRIALADIRKVPAYLARNKEIIRQHAVAALTQHYIDAQCPSGVLETLCYDDYSITFSLATVSEEGKRYNPLGRWEGPLFYAAFDNLNEPATLFVGETSIAAHIVNVYIALMDPTKRRSAVAKRARDDNAGDRIAADRTAANNVNRSNYRKPEWTEKRDDDKFKNAVISLMESQKRQNAVDPQSYPPLPSGSAPDWPRTGRAPLPLE
jgi:hypothetical protein